MNYGVIFLPSVHQFTQVTQTPKTCENGTYHIMHCKLCGIHGKQYVGESCVTILKDYPSHKIRFCTFDKMPDPFIGRMVKIKQCYAAGANYNNCLPDSQHKVIHPPFEQINGDRGVWIMGKTSPVKIMFDEFEFIEISVKRTKHK